MTQFNAAMRDSQIKWRRAQKKRLPSEWGRQNGHTYEHILPAEDWELGLWPQIRSDTARSLPTYLKTEGVRRHVGSHNLCSSWALCANLYFPFRGESGRQLVASFLRDKISRSIRSVTRLELEYEAQNQSLKPSKLLGEMDGGRGAGQTSPDLAFEVETETGPGVILIECKYTEHNFYPCSGRQQEHEGRPPNPNPGRCLRPKDILASPAKQCHLCKWGRSYWDYLQPIINPERMDSLKACPAAYGGYQLFRQQALAEGIAKSGDYSLVVSAVAYDRRNEGLMKSMARSTGLKDIEADWPKLFRGSVQFTTFTHQDWVTWVASQGADEWQDWLKYVTGRYEIVGNR